jgi:hypothetical protein
LTGDEEYEYFFKWAQHFNNYIQEIVETVPVYCKMVTTLYVIKAYDEYTKTLSFFAENEVEFLEVILVTSHEGIL